MTETAFMQLIVLWAALGAGITAWDSGVKILWAVPFFVFLLFVLDANP